MIARSRPSSSGLAVGAIASAHGIAGAVRARLFNVSAADLPPGTMVTVIVDGERRTLELQRAEPVPGKPMARLHFRGVSTRDEALALRGATLEVSRDVLGHLADDEYFLADVVGRQVRGTVGEGPSRALGTIVGVGSNGAQDLLEIETEVGGRLITWFVPVLPAFIQDVTSEVVSVALPEGMGPEDVA